MKNRKNMLTYIVAALSILVTSASSSPGAAPAPAPAKLHGRAHARRVHHPVTVEILNPAGLLGWWHVGPEHRSHHATIRSIAAGSPHTGRLPQRQPLPGCSRTSS